MNGYPSDLIELLSIRGIQLEAVQPVDDVLGQNIRGITLENYHALHNIFLCKSVSQKWLLPVIFLFLTPPLGTVLTEWVWQHQGIIHDVDGSLLGEAGRTLHAANPILRTHCPRFNITHAKSSRN